MEVLTPLTRRATRTFRLASQEQRQAGELWYVRAHEVAAAQAQEHGVALKTAAGVLAALSPRMGWGMNVALAERMLASQGTLDSGALGRSLAQARAIFAGEAPELVLRGPKVRAFYMAILTAGAAGPPVIDRHAWDMLTGSRLAPGPNLTQYRQAAATIERAAKILGKPPHVVQATTWIVWRRKFWSERAFAPPVSRETSKEES